VGTDEALPGYGLPIDLPPLILDAMTSQSVIFRARRAGVPRRGTSGIRGLLRVLSLNCTHVWNYAQTHARLFPEIDRNMRESDLLVYLHPDGRPPSPARTSRRFHRRPLRGHRGRLPGLPTQPDRSSWTGSGRT